jgi:hypothetical protein
MRDLTQLGIALPGRTAADHEHGLDIGIEQAFAQRALPDHAGRTEQNDFHETSFG